MTRHTNHEETGRKSTRSTRAVIYLRTSRLDTPDEHWDGYSLENQRTTCRRVADSRDAEVIAEFTDTPVFDTDVPLTGVEQLVALVTERDIDYLIVYSLDRLAFRYDHDIEVGWQLGRAGVQILCAQEQAVDQRP